MDMLSDREIGEIIWLLLGLLIASLIAFALYRQVGIFLFALFFYYATRPLYRRLDAHLDDSDLAVTITILAIVLPIVLIVGYALVQGFQEADQFLTRHSLTRYREYLQPYLSLAREGQLQTLWNRLITNPDQPLPIAFRRVVRRVFGRITTVLGFVFTLLGYFFLMLIFLYYLLRDDRKLSGWFYENVGDQRVVEFTQSVDDDLQTVFFSNLAIIAVTATIATIAYYLLNFIAPGTIVSIPVLLGLLIGIATLIPIVGMKIVYIPFTLYLATLSLLTQAPWWHPLAFIAVSSVIVDLIPDIFIRSYLSSRSGINMGLILLGYVLGTIAFGWYGLFLGPIIVVLAVHYAHQVFPELADRVTFD